MHKQTMDAEKMLHAAPFCPCPYVEHPLHSDRVFVTKLTLKPKFLKFTHSTSLRVLSVKCTLTVHPKFAEIFVQTPP